MSRSARTGGPDAILPVPASRGSALVAGGGIGGLAAAVALGRAGWRVTVLEQAPVFWEAGAGMMLTANGLAALDALGVGERVRDEGCAVRFAGVRRSDGRWLVEFPSGRGAVWGVGIHRHVLHAVLLDAAGAVSSLMPGSHVSDARISSPRGEPAVLEWEDGAGSHAAEAELLVIADGAASRLRPLVAPAATLEPSGLSSWRAVVRDSGAVGTEATLWWEPGLEAGVQRIGPDRVYWYALFRHPEGVSVPEDLTEARRRLAGWPAELTRLVDKTKPEAVMRHDLAEVTGVETFVAGRAALVGDAAHAMLPTLTQGANQALEDAVTLAGALAPGLELTRGLADYDTLRRPRAQAVAARARQVARLGVAGRGAGLLPLVPGRVALGWLQRTLAWRPAF